jgi:arylsulfatase A-like enzyme
MRRWFFGVCAALLFAAPASAQDRPNILIIWGDDIGQFNISAYNMGMMGYETPNIDRIADEGMIFTDSYGEQSCTAGRSTFITGQSGFRTGLLKVGLPGADLGLQPEDVTIAELLKPHGYATGQFGKNHLGDRDEMLPTKDSTSSSATCITSMPRKNRRTRTTRVTWCSPTVRPSTRRSVPGASFTVTPMDASRTPGR